jgi:hypothetical protein
MAFWPFEAQIASTIISSSKIKIMDTIIKIGKLARVMGLSGSIGDCTIYNTAKGLQVRKKSSLDKKRFDTDPNFQRSRENTREFGRVAKTTALIKSGFRRGVAHAGGVGFHNRLFKLVFAMLRQDATNARGERKPGQGLELLTGFDINQKARLSSIFYDTLVPEIDVETGRCSVMINTRHFPGSLFGPQSATHLLFVAEAAFFDFDNNRVISDSVMSDYIKVSETDGKPLKLSLQCEVGPGFAAAVGLGIVFYNDTNGFKKQIKLPAYTPFEILKAVPAS